MTLTNFTNDEKLIVIEDKIRNSFRAVKADNDEIKRKIEEISSSLKDKTLSDNLESFKNLTSKQFSDLNKKIDSADAAIKKLKRDVSVDGLRREVVKEVVPIFNDKIKAGLKAISLENREMKRDLNDFKNKWANASDEKLNAGIEEMRANFAKLNKQAIFEMRAVRVSTKRSISEQNEQISQYNARMESYASDLENDYKKVKKSLSGSNQKNFDSLREEHDSDVQKLKGQMAYLKGRVNKEFGKEESKVVRGDKKSLDIKVKSSKLISKFTKLFSKKKNDKKVEKEVSVVAKNDDVKKAKEAVKKNKTLFSNLVSLLADESPNIKVEFKAAKKVSKKGQGSESSIKPVKPVKKLETKEGDGFFNSIIKSMSD